MSKRRLRADEPEESPPESLSPEERRAQRRRERARRKAGHETSAKGPWRRVAIIGAPVTVIAVVAVLLLVVPHATPCVSLGPIPTSAGVPDFPLDHNSSNFQGTWCPGPSTAEAYGLLLSLTIHVDGSSVNLPSAIGRNSSYPSNYDCMLPILTQIGLPSNSFQIISDWFYTYNLSTFFNVWAESYKTVDVSSTYPAQPISYTSSSLFGLTANASEKLQLFVDNQPSSKGPSLDISDLPFDSSTYPSCLATVDGTGHKIFLSYGPANSTVAFEPGAPPGDVSAPANPLAPLLLYGGPLPHFGLLAPLMEAIAKTGSSHPFLELRTALAAALA